MKVIPTGREVLHEAIVVVAGALLAALIINQLPGVKKWLKDKGAIPRDV